MNLKDGQLESKFSELFSTMLVASALIGIISESGSFVLDSRSILANSVESSNDQERFSIRKF